MNFVRMTIAVCVVALAATAAAAQTGGITVKVVDANGDPLPGATVTIANETGFIKTTAILSNKNGVASFPILRPGPGYSIQVDFPGFSTISQSELRVSIGDNLTVPVQMIEEIQERVKVTAQREVIELEKTSGSTKFSDNFISDLPVPGRFYTNVLTMAPGVQDADGDGNPNVHGSRSRDFKAVVSGVSNVDPLTGRQMSRVNPNSIEEMEVITAGAGVEFGGAQGGFARIIQKQGSNEHEGVFEFYWRSSILDGTGADDFSALPDPDFDWIQPAVQLSGPLVRDKLWYRFSHEIRNIDVPVNVTSGIEVTTFEEGTHADQITWQVSPRNKLALQWQSDPSKVRNFGVSSTTPGEATQSRDDGGDTWNLAWTAPYSPKVLVETNVGWQDTNFKVFPTTRGLQNDCITDAAAPPFLKNAQCFDVLRGRRSGSFFIDWDDHRQRLTVDSRATVYGGRFWGMDHTFKLGATIENERYFRDLTWGPEVDFFIINNQNEAADADPEEFELETFGLAFARLAVPQDDEIRATGARWAFYLEDQFKPVQNLSIRLGMRVDREELSSEGSSQFAPAGELSEWATLVDQGVTPALAHQQAWTGYEDLANFSDQLVNTLCEGSPDFENCKALASTRLIDDQVLSFAEVLRRNDDINIVNTNFAPFIGLSWSPWNNGKTAIKASYTRKYNNTPLTIPLNELQPALTDLAYRVDLGTGVAEPDGVISPTVNLSVVDRDLQTPYMNEFRLAIERELFTETALIVSYINRRYRDQIQDININLATGDYGACVRQSTATAPAILPDFSGPGDNDPGDGLLDDCVGELIAVDQDPSSDPFGRDTFFVQRPDGIPDLYVQNPLWGDVFLIGNFNETDYEAFQLELIRRQYRSWEMNASYTYSIAEGDGEDFFQSVGDDPSLRDDVFGYQSYDQRHVVKLNATTITPWGIRLGTSVSWQSGLPYSLLLQEPSQDTLPPFVTEIGNRVNSFRVRQRYTTGQRNDQRNDSYWNVDLKATKEINLGRGMNMQLSAEIFNLFDDNTYIVYNPDLEYGRQINGTNDALRRFGRQWQIGMKLAF